MQGISATATLISWNGLIKPTINCEFFAVVNEPCERTFNGSGATSQQFIRRAIRRCTHPCSVPQSDLQSCCVIRNGDGSVTLIVQHIWSCRIQHKAEYNTINITFGASGIKLFYSTTDSRKEDWKTCFVILSLQLHALTEVLQWAPTINLSSKVCTVCQSQSSSIKKALMQNDHYAKTSHIAWAVRTYLFRNCYTILFCDTAQNLIVINKFCLTEVRDL